MGQFYEASIPTFVYLPLLYILITSQTENDLKTMLKLCFNNFEIENKMLKVKRNLK